MSPKNLFRGATTLPGVADNPDQHPNWGSTPAWFLEPMSLAHKHLLGPHQPRLSRRQRMVPHSDTQTLCRLFRKRHTQHKGHHRRRLFASKRILPLEQISLSFTRLYSPTNRGLLVGAVGMSIKCRMPNGWGLCLMKLLFDLCRDLAIPVGTVLYS